MAVKNRGHQMRRKVKKMLIPKLEEAYDLHDNGEYVIEENEKNRHL